MEADLVGPIEQFVSFFRGETDQIEGVVAVDGVAVEDGAGEIGDFCCRCTHYRMIATDSIKGIEKFCHELHE